MEKMTFRVWATGDSVRVNPITGHYLEDRTDIHKTYPTGNYQEINSFWDASREMVTLHGARNEFVSFQIIVESIEPDSKVEVTFDSLVGPEGVKIGDKNIALFKAWYSKVVDCSNGYEETSLGPGWYPDALLPADEDGSVSFTIPSNINHIGQSQKNQTVWIDIYIPRERCEAPPGVYQGEIQISSLTGQKTIKVLLKVWDFDLPEEIHCRGDIWNGSLKRMEPEQELLWYQMAHQHRFHPGVAGYAPEVTGTGNNLRLDWTEYDKRLSRYFDGSAFTEKYGYWGPGYGVPIPHIQLPFDCNKRGRTGGWPAQIGPEWKPDAAYEASWMEACRQTREHFDEDPTWRKVGKIVFIGALDESYSEDAYNKMVYYSKLLRKGLGKGWFQYRIDGGYSGSAMSKLHPYVELWVCHTAGWDHPKMMNFRGKGVETWFYGPMVYERRANSACGSNTFTDLDLLVNRGVGWAAWKLKSGYCEWEFDAIYDDKRQLQRPTVPYEEAWTRAKNFRSGRNEFNGSGLLIFRGELNASGKPIPTIRLKAHRRGMQDYEYFWLLREVGKGAEADKLMDSIITTIPFGRDNWENTDIWIHNPETWDEARIKAGELLHSVAEIH